MGELERLIHGIIVCHNDAMYALSEAEERTASPGELLGTKNKLFLSAWAITRLANAEGISCLARNDGFIVPCTGEEP